MKKDHSAVIASLNSRLSSNSGEHSRLNSENSSLKNQINSLIQSIESLKVKCKKHYQCL